MALSNYPQESGIGNDVGQLIKNISLPVKYAVKRSTQWYVGLGQAQLSTVGPRARCKVQISGKFGDRIGE